MIKIIILQKDDIDVTNSGFNAFIARGDTEIIVQSDAVDQLIEQLQEWRSKQFSDEFKKEYLHQTNSVFDWYSHRNRTG